MDFEIIPPKPPVMTRYLRAMTRGGTRAISRALNRGATTAVKTLSLGIRRRLRVKSGDVKKATRVQRATPARLRVTLAVSRRTLPLKRFYRSGGQRPGKKTTRQGKPWRYPKPVRVSVTPGSTKEVQAGFLGPGGHIFKRKGAKKSIQGRRGSYYGQPIHKLFAPSLGAISQDAWPEAARSAGRTYVKILQHEFRRLR